MAGLFGNWRNGENSSTIFFLFYLMCSCWCFICNRLGNRVDRFSMRSPKGTVISTYITLASISFLIICFYHCVIEPWKNNFNNAFRCSFKQFTCEEDSKCITDPKICKDGDVHNFKSCKIKKCTMKRQDCIGVVPPPIKDPEMQFYRLVSPDNPSQPLGGNLESPPSYRNEKDVFIVTSCDEPKPPKKRELKCGNRVVYI